MRLDLAVVIVSWNVRALVLDAIRTVRDDLAASGLTFEIWVVDNASSDGSADAIREAFADVHLLALDENIGFAAGNNCALRALGFNDQPNPDGPRAVYLLNPDTRTCPGATRRLFDTLMEAPKAGMVGARLEYADGTFQHSAFAFPGLAQLAIDLYPFDRLPPRLFGRLYDSRLNGRYPRAKYAGDQPFEVGHPLGATMLIRREAIERTGLFDATFYMYVEEVDWALRVHRAGYKIYCEPRAVVVHLAGQSTKQVRAASLLNLWKSRYRLFGKHWPRWKVALARLIIRGGARLQGRRVGQREELAEAWRAVGRL